MKLRQITENIPVAGKPDRDANLLIRALRLMKSELVELVLMYLQKMPEPAVELAKAIRNFQRYPTIQTKHDLSFAIQDFIKLPIPLVGFGLIGPLLPLFGLPLSAVAYSKLFAYLSYVVYRAAANHPQWRGLIKNVLPKSFLEPEIKKKVEQDRTTQKQQAVARSQTPYTPPQFKPSVYQLAQREERQKPGRFPAL